jgi:type II secretory pathway pseudopilin PulG
MASLLIVGIVVAVIALYLADRFVKARAQTRRLREMNDRLAAATARVDDQQAEKRAEVKASAELTNVMPAINRPPLSLPGVAAHGPARPKPSRERPPHRGARTGERSHSGDHGRSGDHGAARAGERPGA